MKRSEWLGAVGGALLALALPACSLLQAPTYVPAPHVLPAPFLGAAGVSPGPADVQPCVPDVARALGELPHRGRPFGFHLIDEAPLGGFLRHWQGIQRATTAGARHLFLSRSGSGTAVIVVQIASHPGGQGPLAGSRARGAPPAEDRVVARIPFDAGFAHAGGLSLVGGVLAVPMDSRHGSRVAFYDVDEPEHPRRLGTLEHRGVSRESDTNQASAVGGVRLRDGRYLLVLGVHSSKMLDFYRTRGTSLRDSTLAFEYLGTLLGLDVGGYQNLALMSQCDGTLYLVGTHNTAFPPPSGGWNHVHWYRLLRGPGAMPRLSRGARRRIDCEECNLAAAAGLFLGPAGEVTLYASQFWKEKPGNWVRLEEFGPVAPAP